MKAEIISVGTEILLGGILNTNSRYLSQKLAENAVDVYHHTTAGDNVRRLAETFDAAAKRADLIIASGGLGPTADDVTAEALASFLKIPLVFDKQTHTFVRHQLQKRGFKMSELIAKQCNVPKDAILFQNDQGTAPGIFVSVMRGGTKKYFLLLPGPPRELEPLFEKKVLPFLLKKLNLKKECFLARSVKIAGLPESSVAEKINTLLNLKPPVTVGIYAKPGQVELKIMAKFTSRQQAEKEVTRVEKIIRKKLGRYVYGVGEETLASAVGKLLRQKKMTLSAAESCTGGLFSSLITDVPGSSDYFLGGVVAYHNKIKMSQLNIPETLLKKYGAVSPQVASQMARNVKKIFRSAIGIGITGIAGPSGGTPQKPVGLVYAAVSTPKKTILRQLNLRGSRSEIRNRAAHEVLNTLRLFLLN